MSAIQSLGHTIAPLDQPDTPAPTAACAIVTNAYERPHDTSQNDWLHDVAADIVAAASADALAWLAVVAPFTGTSHWETHHFALAGPADPAVAHALAEEARDGFPNDDLATHAGQRAEHPPFFAGPRAELIADDHWPRTRLAAFRRALALHDLARAVVPFESNDRPRTMLIQLDLLKPDTRPTERDLAILAAIAPAIVAAYRNRFVLLEEHRARLLARLTPAQAPVLQYLVEGLSETEVARAVGRSAHTIHDHTKTIYHTLGVNTRLQLRDLWFNRPPAGATPK